MDMKEVVNKNAAPPMTALEASFRGAYLAAFGAHVIGVVHEDESVRLRMERALIFSATMLGNFLGATHKGTPEERQKAVDHVAAAVMRGVMAGEAKSDKDMEATVEDALIACSTLVEGLKRSESQQQFVEGNGAIH